MNCHLRLTYLAPGSISKENLSGIVICYIVFFWDKYHLEESILGFHEHSGLQFFVMFGTSCQHIGQMIFSWQKVNTKSPGTKSKRIFYSTIVGGFNQFETYYHVVVYTHPTFSETKFPVLVFLRSREDLVGAFFCHPEMKKCPSNWINFPFGKGVNIQHILLIATT